MDMPRLPRRLPASHNPPLPDRRPHLLRGHDAHHIPAARQLDEEDKVAQSVCQRIRLRGLEALGALEADRTTQQQRIRRPGEDERVGVSVSRGGG